MHIRIAAIALCMAMSSLAQAENPHAGKMTAYYTQNLKAWAAGTDIVAAIKAQNEAHKSLSDADIEKLDQQWRAEVKAKSGPLTTSLADKPLSKLLEEKRKEAGGKITELIIMDFKGLNVAQAPLTSDYMQGDEPKWQKTFLVGPTAIFVDELDFDKSSKRFQAQLSATIVDPANGAAIGAITVGFDVEKL